MTERNILYYGDNLDILREHVPDESVDLVYLDPPFNSNASYNVLFAAQDGTQAAAQIKAFGDTWRWDEAAAHHYRETVEAGGQVSAAMQAFHMLLKPSSMLAYLAMMAPRLVELQRVLKPTGSLYLHCDPTASHYLKLLLDAVFGPVNFRNEIIWRRTGSHNSPRRFGPIHDVLLFFSKSDRYLFRKTHRPYLQGHVDQYFSQQDQRGRFWTNALTGAGTRRGQSGQPWRSYSPTAIGRHWAIPGTIFEELGLDRSLSTQEKLDALDAAGFIDHPPPGSTAMPTYRQYLDDSPGMMTPDIWAYQPHTHGVLYGSNQAIDEDVRWLRQQGDPERLGYPTQKPEALLERIIRASSNEGDTILDPFCGCGTTVAVAERLKRRWVGIDITYLAVSLMKHRLGKGATYTVVGEPTTVEDARALARDDPYQFQWWAVGLVGARPTEQKKGADQGIDGRLYFHDEGANSKTKQIILSVKSGGTGPGDVRDLRGVVQREGAQIGVLITLREPTRPMRTEVASAAPYRSPWNGKDYPGIQLRTVGDLLAGKEIDYPDIGGGNVTFKKARRVQENTGDQLSL